MGGLKVRVHPLILPFGIYYLLTGRIFVFVIYSVVAVVHELGHSFAAATFGYKLNRITLMPFGAIVSGNIEGLKPKDELTIALAGPFINLATGILFVAVWWMFPETYAFTDVAAEANFTMAAVNFIPVYPLDGGRALSSFLAQRIGSEKARVVCKTLGIAFATGLLGLFITSLFFTVNFSILFFAAFAFFGAIDKNKENRYIRIYSTLSKEKLKRGVPYRRQAIDKSVPLIKMLRILDANALNEIIVYDGDRVAAKLDQRRITEIMEKGDLYSPIAKYIAA